MKLFRMHLKTDPPKPATRNDVVSYCLNNSVLAYGWSGLYGKGITITNTSDLLRASEKEGKPYTGLKNFLNLKINDLIWARDLDGFFYICRVIGAPKCNEIKTLDISSVVPVEMFKVGTSVPGLIFHRFNRSPSPTLERIKDEQMLFYSQTVFNEQCSLYKYPVDNKMQLDIWKLLNGFDLEELILDYIQLKYDYYLSKDSVARGDTTIKIEGELFPRKRTGDLRSAVVQVKHSINEKAESFVEKYRDYVKNGKRVFLFLGDQNYCCDLDGIECILKDDVYSFVKENYDLFPDSLQTWFKMSSLNG